MCVFKAGKYEFLLKERTYVMGILNVTPDSFFDGNNYMEPSVAVAHAIQLQAEGADIVDIGAQSTRPGYKEISPEEELERLIPVLKALKGKLHVPISVDTYYPLVAEKALVHGASIINDVHGLKDKKMLEVVASSDCGVVVMHDGPMNKTKNFFEERLRALRDYNIQKDRICFDPGIGFGKNYNEDVFAIKNIQNYRVDEIPILIGLSNKRVIKNASGANPMKDRLYSTIAANILAVQNGANFIRVHDVKAHVLALNSYRNILKG